MIRSELDVLLDKVDDQALRAELRTQIDRLKQKRSFGLVFERHIPERVRLPQHPIRVGSQVVSRDDDDSPTYEVMAIVGGTATIQRVRDPDGAYLPAPEHRGETEQASLDSLVVISDFGEPVLPGLRHVGSVERGGDKPYHVVINGENHHALEALRFTHAGKVDCIYIDPPYNTGARDWKYDNDYVDDTDAYRHSKWLAFMERRLKLATDLLNPEDSVLIVTIDEKEYLRLGLLLEQTFRGSTIQMATIVTNPNGVARGRELSRVEEFAYFVFFGDAGAAKVSDDLLTQVKKGGSQEKVRWEWLLRGGTNSRRQDRPRLFYPVFVDPQTGRVADVGDPIPMGGSRSSVANRPGLTTVWPIRTTGEEANWRASHTYLKHLLAAGYARVGAYDAKLDRWALLYLGKAQIDRIRRGELVVTGYRPDGSAVVEHGASTALSAPKTVWNRQSHNAGEYGSRLVKRILGGREFPFPKSIYAVEDALRVFVQNKPDAVVLDFFAGSGTTAHAVARLNKQDGGRRQSLLVTNNEVSAEESKDLRDRGFRPGEFEWETVGIFEHITRPRVTAAITGRTPQGDAIQGEYKFTDQFPMADGFEENVAFVELRYLDADDVDLGLAYDDLASLLWLRAGAQGRIARRMDDAGVPVPFDWTDRYGILFDEDHWRAFVAARPESAAAAFITTWSPAIFAGIAAELPSGMDVVRLYDTYLSQFLPDRVGS